MPSCNKTYTITEYSGFTRGVEAFGYEALPQKTFDALEAIFLLTHMMEKQEPSNCSSFRTAQCGQGNYRSKLCRANYDD